MAPMIRDEGLTLALRKADGPVGLARLLGCIITSQAISQWQRVPAERVIEVARVTRVPRSKLRPDLYPTSSGAQRHAR